MTPIAKQPHPQRFRWRSAAMAASILVVATACGGHDTTETEQTTTTRTTQPEPAYLRVSNRWISAYDDLMTADGTFIRAYVESDFAIILGGGREGIYPGFADADRGVRGIDEYSELRDGYNTSFFGIGRVTELADGVTRATVCKFVSNGGRSGTFLFVDYRREGTPPPAAQSGPAQRPSTNKFGNWYVVDTSSATGDPQAREDCSPLRPANPVDEGEPPLPPFPGWPAT